MLCVPVRSVTRCGRRDLHLPGQHLRALCPELPVRPRLAEHRGRVPKPSMLHVRGCDRLGMIAGQHGAMITRRLKYCKRVLLMAALGPCACTNGTSTGNTPRVASGSSLGTAKPKTTSDSGAATSGGTGSGSVAPTASSSGLGSSDAASASGSDAISSGGSETEPSEAGLTGDVTSKQPAETGYSGCSGL